jgi:tRNA threonylcarbamoyladenosine biosynthesis protein TsaE
MTPDLPTPTDELQITLPDEQATQALGSAFARVIVAVHAGLRIYLSGELGSGKTTLARATLRELGVTGRIKSPSYALVEQYELVLPATLEFMQSLSLYCYHFDFYRFASPGELLEAGFRETLGDSSLCLVEWPEKAWATGHLPAPDLWIRLSSHIPGRSANLSAYSESGLLCLAAAKSFTLR